jgi:hypothetical protein
MLVAIREGIRGCSVAVTTRIFLFVCGKVHPRTRDMDTGTLEKELSVGEASLLHGSRVPLAWKERSSCCSKNIHMTRGNCIVIS